MTREYVEVFMDGSFDVIKGFVSGYFLGAGVTRRPFFHVNGGMIRHDTLIGSLKALLAIESHVPFCMELSMLDNFKKSVAIAEERLDIRLKQVKRITGVQFDFEHEIYNRELASICKNLLTHLSGDLDVIDYEPVEDKHEEYPDLTVASMAHSYTYKGKGIVRGSFQSVIGLFFAVKESRCSDHIEIKHIEFELAEL